MKTSLQILVVSLLSVLLFACSDSEDCKVHDWITGDDTCSPPTTNPPKNSTPQIGVDGNGNALLKWKNYSGSDLNYNVASRLYAPSNGWGTKELLGAIGVADSCRTQPHNIFLEMVMINSGTAIAMWAQLDQVLVKRYTPDTGWTSATSLGTGIGCYPEHGVVMNDNGDAVAIWIDSSEGTLRAAGSIGSVSIDIKNVQSTLENTGDTDSLIA